MTCKKQFFVDDKILTEMENVVKTLNPAKKHPANPVLFPKYPWDATRCQAQFGLYDSKEKSFKLIFLKFP